MTSNAFTTILLLMPLAVQGLRDPDRETLGLLGYHEGTRRVVKCGQNGVLNGVTVRFHTGWSYEEPFIAGVSLLCSSGQVSIEHVVQDLKDRYIFGRSNTSSHTKTVTCEEGLGIDGFRWRMAEQRNVDEEGAEARLGGLTVLCNSRAGNSPKPVALDPDPTAVYDQDFSCKKTTAYAGSQHGHHNFIARLPTPRLHTLAMWYTPKSISGMEPLECIAGQ